MKRNSKLDQDKIISANIAIYFGKDVSIERISPTTTGPQPLRLLSLLSYHEENKSSFFLSFVIGT